MITRGKQILRIALGKSKAYNWPRPDHSAVKSDPTFLFILTPPYSGSTALAQVLNSGHGSMLLHERGEGHCLIPGMCRDDRWHEDKQIDWDSVKAVWWSKIRFIEQHVGSVRVVIEKSPPHMVRTGGLFEAFPKHKVLVFNRNPYANCASILYRLHRGSEKSEKARVKILRNLAATWVERAERLRGHVNDFSPVVFTYEKFCSAPESCVQEVMDQLPELEHVDTSGRIEVKDYKFQGISDQNRRQIGTLSELERAEIGNQLDNHEELLQFFGYTSNWKQDIEQGGAGNAGPGSA